MEERKETQKLVVGSSSKISVQFSLTVNLGDWNSAKLGATLEDVIENQDEFEIKFDHMYKRIRDKVVTELTTIQKIYNGEKGRKGRG